MNLELFITLVMTAAGGAISMAAATANHGDIWKDDWVSIALKWIGFAAWASVVIRLIVLSLIW